MTDISAIGYKELRTGLHSVFKHYTAHRLLVLPTYNSSASLFTCYSTKADSWTEAFKVQSHK